MARRRCDRKTDVAASLRRRLTGRPIKYHLRASSSDGRHLVACTVRNIRISTDILWRVFYILTGPIPYTGWPKILAQFLCAVTLGPIKY